MSYAGDVTLISLLAHTDNYAEPKPNWNEKSTILGVIITFMSLSVSCIFFRLYTRIFISKSFGVDDVFVILFMVCRVVLDQVDGLNTS